ncbi:MULTISPECIES: dienelactone hydrolase family protein [Streptomyces]|uniref:Dienelactone hydrolase n=4 Tax=Streptomyces TaxID=1883 RepID=A0A8H9LLC5_9ACTN|nr:MULTISPECIES: dienelactone hydrolase family protein [Streptomyces]NEE40688.1 dienelactone hydrolase [Streptomyces sp. SID7982]NEE46824.1 dienelactone hydrolase [Streptomyces sp. SID8455]MBL3807224.1 dienelactone hydrolase family protein [Streptomyces sp. BRB081]MDQ0296031.1 dienelactone hydrolase [Streptomyces sp. DSM 41037]NEC10996.1 dienelactone hydrolase [Streptomyces sp. SID8014]
MEILLIHSVYGVRPALEQAAERLREAGHQVHVPDLFEGLSPADMEEGLALRDEIGTDELLKRAVRAAAPHSDKGLVYAGFSLGGAIAQNLALADEKARGLVLFSGTSDLADDADAEDLPVQLHVTENDPFEPHDWLNAWYLRMRRAGADVEVYRYPGAGHLYTDPDLPDHDPEAAEATWRTVQGFLDSL